ncbi:MAG: TonB-dependent receptor [Saprospiraceae bacterium]|nr:TonB-dependent receptor [Saprospiraceae bacterium]
MQKISGNIGLRYSIFNSDITYSSLQPRLSLNYLLNNSFALKASYARMTQFLHVLVNDALGVPTDSWIISKKEVLPAQSWQIAFGIAKNIFKDYEFSLEFYQKGLENLVSYKEGSGFLSQESNWEDKVTQGKGTSRGIELLIQKKEGKLAGWVSYTLAQTDRQFDLINEGKTYPFRYDRRHEFSIVGTYRITNRITFSANWSFATGNSVTLPFRVYRSVIVKQNFDGEEEFFSTFIDYGERNGFRTRAIHRLDFGFEFYKKRKMMERRWSVGFYNAYNRSNPFYFLL